MVMTNKTLKNCLHLNINIGNNDQHHADADDHVDDDKMVMMKTSNHSVHLLTTTFLNVLWSGRVKQSLLSVISSELVSKPNLMYGEVEQGPLESGWGGLCSSVQEIPNAVHQLVTIVNLVMMIDEIQSIPVVISVDQQ